MDARAIARLRLISLRTSGPPLEDAQAVVGWLGAVQAQEYGLAKWSLGQRTKGVADSDVDTLLAQGRIIRTHILRPTWHFVLPADIRWMMALTGPRVQAKTRLRMGQLGLDDAFLTRACSAIAGALAGGRRMTRQQLRVALSESGLEADAGRLAYVLMHAELELLVCSGGLDGKQQTYALLDEIAPAANDFERDQALAELTRRYFRSHGPSAIPDFTWWSGLTVADARRGIEMAGADLARIELDGTAYWLDATLERDAAPSDEVHLLQTFDEFVVGFQRTRGLIDVDRLSGPGTWNPNSFTNPLVIDGQIAGGWRREKGAPGALIVTRPLRPFSPTERRALEVAVERYAQFLGVPATVVYRPA